LNDAKRSSIAHVMAAPKKAKAFDIGAIVTAEICDATTGVPASRVATILEISESTEPNQSSQQNYLVKFYDVHFKGWNTLWLSGDRLEACPYRKGSRVAYNLGFLTAMAEVLDVKISDFEKTCGEIECDIRLEADTSIVWTSCLAARMRIVPAK
jgi:hypothetical protein